jgi:hypothetical protein
MALIPETIVDCLGVIAEANEWGCKLVLIPQIARILPEQCER